MAKDAEEYGSLGALADELWNRDSDGADPATAEDALEAYLQWCSGRGIDLWPHQEDACLALAAGDHVILSTPTGSGKSMVALFMHFLALSRDERSYYTAPIKALVSEKFFNLVECFGREYVGMITGDVRINTDAPIICCTQEILANDALRAGEDAEIACVAADEFHFFADPDRGWAWQVPLLTLPQTQFLLMSATLGNTSHIQGALEQHSCRPVDTIADAPRPIPLSYEYVDTALEGTVELAVREGKAPLYIVHFSQEAALSSAQALASSGLGTKEQRRAIKEASGSARFSTAFGKTLKRLLDCGVGVHHAGMLPRYRLLVEKLAQQGLLPIICGTDTLGVGINVPIHTVVLTQLTKFDGHRMRRLRAREFHQIAGRAGRAGFDTEGLVIAQAPEHEIENARALARAGNDEKKRKRIKKKHPPEGFVNWSKSTFDKLIASPPEQLKPRLRITHAIVLAQAERGGDAWARTLKLIEDSLQTAEEKAALVQRASEIFATLESSDVLERETLPDGTLDYRTTVDLPDDFALDQPLSPFLLAALELLDPEDAAYALDAISFAEATLEDPRQVLRMQEKRARDKAMAAMKAEGVEYEERMERIAEATYPRPCEDILEGAFARYCQDVPWACDYQLRPKSVLRDMVETSANFKGYIAGLGIARSEGLLLRYLSDAYRVLQRTIPEEKRDERLRDITSWLGFMVRSIDSSLVDEWEAAGTLEDEPAPVEADAVVSDRRAVTLTVRNALFARVRMAAAGQVKELGAADGDWGFSARAWAQVLEDYHAEHEEILLDGDARSTAYFELDESDEKTDRIWHVRQTFRDEEDARDFAIWTNVDLDATQESGEAVFANYRVGFIEDLLAE